MTKQDQPEEDRREFYRRAHEILPAVVDRLKERAERKWPDDFRGFGSNVRPRKQR